MIAKANSAVTYTASGSAIAFGLSANELAATIGAAVAVISMCVNFWFKYQHLKLAKAMAAVKGDGVSGE